jgi:TPP-dependent pyruvate/acetoin dehydrogenase alpha subunit
LRAELQQQQGQLTSDEWEEMDRGILAKIEAAVYFAKTSPFPKPEAALDDVFSEVAR